MRTNWKDQEILDALRYWAERYGRTPRWIDWVQGDPEGLRPTSFTVRDRCGSWTEALIMAGLETHTPQKGPQQKFSRADAARLRKRGLSNYKIGALLGVSAETIRRALGPSPQMKRKPRTAAERRKARIAALQRALEKEDK